MAQEGFLLTQASIEKIRELIREENARMKSRLFRKPPPPTLQTPGAQLLRLTNPLYRGQDSEEAVFQVFDAGDFADAPAEVATVTISGQFAFGYHIQNIDYVWCLPAGAGTLWYPISPGRYRIDAVLASDLDLDGSLTVSVGGEDVTVWEFLGPVPSGHRIVAGWHEQPSKWYVDGYDCVIHEEEEGG